MRPVYHPNDIEKFKLTEEQKRFLIDTDLDLDEIKFYFRAFADDYYKNCQPVGYI